MIDSEQLQSISEAKPKKMGFASDMLKLVSGTAFSQILLVLISPILTRLFDPNAFGVFNVFSSFVNILGETSTLRYNYSIMLPEKDEEASSQVAVSLISVLLVTAISIPILWLWGGALVQVLNVGELKPYLWLIPVFIVLNGAYNTLTLWNSRTKKFGRLSISRVIASFCTAIAQIAAGLMGYANGLGFILASGIGSLIATVVLGGQIYRDDVQLLSSGIAWSKVKHGFSRYYQFALYDVPGSLLNTISWQLPVFFLSAFFSPAVVGFYSLGNRVLRMPLYLVSGAIAQVFYQRAAEAHNSGQLAKLVEDVYRRLVSFGLFPMLMMAVISEELFSLLFGQGYREAGTYAQILSIWSFFWFISSPLASLFKVLEKQDEMLKLNIIIFVSRLIVLFGCSLTGNIILTLNIFSLSGILVYGYMSMIVMKYSGVSWSKQLSILAKNTLIFSPACALLLIIKMVFHNSFLLLSVSALILLVFGLYTLSQEPQARSVFVRILKKRKHILSKA